MTGFFVARQRLRMTRFSTRRSHCCRYFCELIWAYNACEFPAANVKTNSRQLQPADALIDL
jgi:hypothetical protein